MKIVYKNTDGTVGVITPAKKCKLTIEEIAKKDVPKGLDWRIVDVDLIPTSRNYRMAWTDDNPTDTVDVDLERAKDVQKQLMIQKAQERVGKDDFNQQDFTVVKAEIEAISLKSVTSLEDLYNTFPASIDNRKDRRKYSTHK